MASSLTNFCLGFTFGVAFSWTAHDNIIERVYRFAGIDLQLKNDFLSLKDSELRLLEKRALFKNIIEEKGLSARILLMISEANLRSLEESSVRMSFRNEDELNILENKFREYYPELFDGNSGQDFILSLNLKTRCNDHDIPKMLRPRS